jgi:hypothetical protein
VPGGLYIGDRGAATWRARERDGSMSRVTYLTRPDLHELIRARVNAPPRSRAPSFGCARAEKGKRGRRS